MLKRQLKTWWRDFKHIPKIDQSWLTTWFIIYITFIMLDVLAPGFWGSALLKYAGIFLCVIYAYRKYHDDNKLIIALFLTLLADTILVWTDFYTIGVFVFCFAQFMHFLRMTKMSKKTIGAFALIISLLTIYSAFCGYEIIYSLGTLYGLLLISNVVMASRRYRIEQKDFKARCGWYGFVLFIACDTCVALRYMMLHGIIPAEALPLIAFLVWIFYYPSQVLIANSSTRQESAKGRNIAKTKAIS